ncbi:MAG: polysaccharide pyruvyl transferase family protein [Verrucomicrobia bacterium]|nr:polysaccharide pyruvyl transferase family protein [Verrucomicrobiota bacterium]
MKILFVALLSFFTSFVNANATEGIPLYYWRKPNFQNFGDHISHYIVERIVGSPITIFQKTDIVPKRLLAVGSLLGAARQNDVLWGTGMNGKIKPEDYQFTNLDIRAIRGPLTRKFVMDNFQISCPDIYGDPGLLFPYLFPEFTRNPEPSIDVLIIPHYSEERLFPKSAYNHVVYPTEPWDQVIRKILDSKFVISSSLHGLIIAEAYGIPARYLRVTENEPLLKYQDYYAATNRCQFSYATSLLDAIHMRGERPYECDLQKLYDAFPFDLWPFAEKKPFDFTRIEWREGELPGEDIVTYPIETCSECEEDERELLPPSPYLYDLEASPQEFILETKRIILPGHERAFNPSLVRFRGTLLLSFRINEPTSEPTKRVGLAWLDDNYDLIGSPMVLYTPFSHPYLLSLQQDPRLLVIDDHLFMIYNNVVDSMTSSKGLKRMFVAELDYDGENFFIKSDSCIHEFPTQNPNRWEKNWVPFCHDNKLLLSYSIFPHKVFEFNHGTTSCTPYCQSDAITPWEWGAVRGGTQAHLDGDQYLAFFHSSQYMPSTQSDGKVMLHYFMGAYTFSKEPPFDVTAISPLPIVGKNFYNGPMYKTWKPLRVVFPGGFVFDENYVWVAYGRQDNEVWVTKLDKKGLLASLVPTTPKNL